MQAVNCCYIVQKRMESTFWNIPILLLKQVLYRVEEYLN